MPPNMSHLRDAARADTEAARQPDCVPRWGIRKARAVPAPPPTGPHRRAPGSRAPSAQAGAAGPMQTARLASMPPPHFRALPPSGFGATAAGFQCILTLCVCHTAKRSSAHMPNTRSLSVHENLSFFSHPPVFQTKIPYFIFNVQM